MPAQKNGILEKINGFYRALVFLINKTEGHKTTKCKIEVRHLIIFTELCDLYTHCRLGLWEAEASIE